MEGFSQVGFKFTDDSQELNGAGKSWHQDFYYFLSCYICPSPASPESDVVYGWQNVQGSENLILHGVMMKSGCSDSYVL